MYYQYGSGRSQLPFSASDIDIVPGGGTTTATTLYFALQGWNPAGVNLLSDIIGPITIGVGEKLEITVPEDARGDGEAWEAFVISAAPTNTPSAFVQLAKITAINGSGLPLDLPLTITLSSDSHFQLSAVVATVGAMPAAPVNGMLRRVTALGGQVFEFYDTLPWAAWPSNGQTVLPAVGGVWILKPGNFSSYVAQTTDAGGCDRALDQIADTLVRAPRYGLDGEGVRRTLWIRNLSSEVIPAGTRVIFSCTVNDIPQPDGLLWGAFLGYAAPSTGGLRLASIDGDDFPDIGVEKVLENRKTDFALPDDLEPGEAYAVQIFPSFTFAQLNGRAIAKGVVRIVPALGVQFGSYNEMGKALGDWIYPTDDKGWVVPRFSFSTLVLKRSGIVNARSFLGVGAATIGGLAANQANQLIAINGNGAVYRVNTLGQGEALRAILSTEAGVTAACALSAGVTLGGGQGILITCTYPSNGTTATIRPDYPDAIAGLANKAELNPTSICLYVKIGSTLKRFPGRGFVDGVSQAFTLNDWDAGELIGSIPASSSADFGLFAPLAAVAVASGGGNFPAGTCQVAFAFEYDGYAVTKISHNIQQGCIPVPSLTLAEMEQSTRYWGSYVEMDDITAIPQDKVVAWQSRRTTGGIPIIFNPQSMRSADGVSTWLPSWIAADQPGRWEVDRPPIDITSLIPYIIALGG